MKLQDLKGEKLGICVSGGLDSKTVTRRLLEEGLDVLGFTADLAQPDESDINDVARRMAVCVACPSHSSMPLDPALVGAVVWRRACVCVRGRGSCASQEAGH